MIIISKHTGKKKISHGCLEEALDAGLSQSEIARMCNMSRQAVHIRVNYKPQKSDKILAKQRVAFKLRKLGFKYREIAEIIGYKREASAMYAAKKGGELG